jgi:hypothetical protein
MKWIMALPAEANLILCRLCRPITLNGGYPMPGWFDIATLDDSGAEDKAGFEETRARIERVRHIYKHYPYISIIYHI